MIKFKIRSKKITFLICLFFIGSFIFSIFLVNQDFIRGKSNKALISTIYPENTNLSEWNKTWGGNNDDFGFKILIDSSNNMYLLGSTRSFGNGDSDIILIKLNNMGEQLWNRTWGGSDYDAAYDMLIDLSGDIYMTGVTYSFGNGNRDIIVLKFNSMGKQLWNRTFGGNQSDAGNRILIDSSNNIYAIGSTKSFGNGNSDIIVLKLNSMGEYLWNRTWGGSDYDTGYDVILDSSNNLYISGVIGQIQTEDWWGNKFFIEGDVFLVKFNDQGEELWNKTWGTIYEDYANGIGIDSSNNIYISGTYGIQYRIPFEIPIFYGGDIFLSKYNALGDLLWNESWRSEDHDVSSDLVIDASDYVYILSWTEESDEFLENSSITLIKFNSTGEYLWDKSWSSNYTENFPVEIEFSSNENIFILGATYSHSTYDLGIVILHYNKTGEFLWYIRKENLGHLGYCSDMYVDISDTIYIVGQKDMGDDNYDILLVKFFYAPGIKNRIPSDIIFLIMILSGVTLVIIILKFWNRVKPSSSLDRL